MTPIIGAHNLQQSMPLFIKVKNLVTLAKVLTFFMSLDHWKMYEIKHKVLGLVLSCKHGLEHKSIVVSNYSLTLPSPGISGKKALAQSIHLQQHCESLVLYLLSRSNEQTWSFVGEKCIGICKMLENVSGNKVLSHMHVLNYLKYSNKDVVTLENNPRSGWQSTAWNPETVVKAHEC
jgi:hypothetical protein